MKLARMLSKNIDKKRELHDKVKKNGSAQLFSGRKTSDNSWEMVRKPWFHGLRNPAPIDGGVNRAHVLAVLPPKWRRKHCMSSREVNDTIQTVKKYDETTCGKAFQKSVFSSRALVHEHHITPRWAHPNSVHLLTERSVVFGGATKGASLWRLQQWPAIAREIDHSREKDKVCKEMKPQTMPEGAKIVFDRCLFQIITIKKNWFFKKEQSKLTIQNFLKEMLLKIYQIVKKTNNQYAPNKV